MGTCYTGRSSLCLTFYTDSIITVREDNTIESEVIVLKAVTELIDSMVNYQMMSFLGDDPDSSILFHSSIHQCLFNILLVDFLSKTDPHKQAPIKPTSYLDGLRDVASNPFFNKDNSVQLLKESIQEFKDWLEQTVEVDVRLPSIDKETTLEWSRVKFLKMIRNISKHNYLRAISVAEELRDILIKSGITIEIYESLLALADFYERFHSDILNYHSSTIAEFLNNIRWGIHEYLQPEFQHYIVYEGAEHPRMYHYTYPEKINDAFAKECYWDLMDEVRRRPYVKKFKVTKWLKKSY